LESLTQGCTNSRARRVYNIYHTLPDTSIPKGNDITQKNANDCGHAATSNALKDLDICISTAQRNPTFDIFSYTGGNKLVDVLRKTAKQASYSKNGIREQQASLSTKDITQFAIKRLEGRQGEKVGSRNPTS
jgi:hypothetical protein